MVHLSKDGLSGFGFLSQITIDEPYVSFDLFDTLIERRHLSVHEVHDAISAYACTFLGSYGVEDPHTLTSARYNTTDFMKASQQGTVQEPLISDVWRRILGPRLLDRASVGELVDRLVRFELEIEKDNLQLVAGALNAIQQLKASGKVLIAISDMYFSQKDMEEILGKLGLLCKFDFIFVSAEVNLTKQTGDLFRYVCDKVGAAPNDILHIGDNARSDHEMAKAAGLTAVLVDHQPAIKRPAYGQRPAIFREIADLNKIFLFNTLFLSRSQGVEHIYFLARDGCLMANILEGWKGPIIDELLTGISFSEIYLNRSATCWGAVNFQQQWLPHAVGLAFWLNGGRAAGERLSETLGLRQVPNALEGVLLDARIDTSTVVDAILALGIERDVKTMILGKQADLRAYLQGIGFFDRQRVALCDLGYSGSAARDLNIFLIQESIRLNESVPPVIYLNLIASGDNFGRNGVASVPYVYFNDTVILPVESLPDDLRHNFAWLELFFKHPTMRPVNRFISVHGATVPDISHSPRPDHALPSDEVLAASEWRGEDIALLWMASQRALDDFVTPLIDRFADPDLDTVVQISRAVYEADAISGEGRSAILVDPNLSTEDLVEVCRQQDYWIAGSKVASAAARLGAAVEAEPAPPGARTSPGLLRKLFERMADPLTSADVDIEFYKAYYLDLRNFDEAFLRRHYVNHGRREGRFNSKAALLRSLTETYGSLPADFDPYIYVSQHDDLKIRLLHPLHGYRHYLKYGRIEGRGYRYRNDQLEDELERMLLSGTLVFSNEERRRLPGTSAAHILCDRHGIGFGPWVDLLIPAEFKVLNQTWAGGAGSKGECLKLFVEEGVARCAALSILARFDPDDYRRYEPGAAHLLPEEAYRHWLNIGFYTDRAPSEGFAVYEVIGATEYPTAFDWERYRDVDGSLSGGDRVRVLKAFVDAQDVDHPSYVAGRGAASLLTVLGTRALNGGRFDEAQRYFKAGLSHGGHRALLLHRLGDAYRGAELNQLALSSYGDAIVERGPNRWSFINGALLALGADQLDVALYFIDAGRSQWSNLKPWRQTRDLVYRRYYDVEIARAARSAQPERELTSAVSSMVERIGCDLPRFTPRDNGNGPVLVLTGRPLNPPVTTEAGGRAVSIYTLDGVQQVYKMLFAASSLIVHDLPVCHTVLKLVLTARALGVRAICVLGMLGEVEGMDLSTIVSSDAGRPSPVMTLPLCPQYVCAAALFDKVITRFAGLISCLQPFLGSAILDYPAPAPLLLPRGETTVVMIVGGWRINDRTKRRIILKLKEWMESNRHATLVFDVSFDPAFARTIFRGRVESVALASGLDDIDALLTDVSLVIEIGTNRDFLFVAEAARKGIANLLIDEANSEPSKDGFRRRCHIDRLIPSMIEALSDPLPDVVDPKAPSDEGRSIGGAAGKSPRAPGVQRILFLNVYFPPQSIGGATRVLKDNLDFFLDSGENPDRFAIVTTDLENSAVGEIEVDSYRSVPVYRIATPQEIDMDWRMTNLDVATVMRQILRTEQPDLVHVHCVPRLSVAPVDECRKAGIPYIVTLHDAWWISDYPFLTDAGGLTKLPGKEILLQEYVHRIGAHRSWVRNYTVRNVLLHARKRLAVSASFGEIYRNCGVPCDILENGVSSIGEASGRSSRSDTVHICHVGGTEHHKGAYLLEIALRGIVSQHLTVTVVDLGQDTGHEQTVTWGNTLVRKIGRIPSDQMSEFYANMDVLVAPSTWPESFGLVTREAIKLGLWVIAGRAGAMGDCVVPEVNGFLVDVSSGNDLGEVLARIDADPERFQRPPDVAANLRTSNDQGRELLEIYRSVINEAAVSM